MAQVEYIASGADGEISHRGAVPDAELVAPHAAFMLTLGLYQVVAPKDTDAALKVIDLTDKSNPKLIDRPTTQPVPVAPAWRAYQKSARQLLDASDITVTRCAEAGVDVPVEWKTYREALRVILRAVTGDPTVALPIVPAKPTGLS